MPAFTAGFAGAVSMDNASDVLTAIKSYVNSVSLTINGQTYDVSVLGDVWQQFVAGQKGATVSINYFIDPTIDAIMFAAIAAIKSLTFDPQGTGTGTSHYAAEMIGTSIAPSAPVNGAATSTFSATVTGTVTRTTNA